MATLEQFKTALAEVDAETTRIGSYLENVVVQLNRTDLTAEQEAVLLADLQAAADRLKGIAKTPEAPIPPDELPPIVLE